MKRQCCFAFFAVLIFVSFSCVDKNKTLRKAPAEVLSAKIQEGLQAMALPSNMVGARPPLALTEFGRRLQDEGRPEAELRGFMQLEQENEYLDGAIGEVTLIGRHYVYRVIGKNYDGPQTSNACGIWAVRRKLRHMHHLGIDGIEEDAWYRDSDRQIRSILVEIPALPQEESPLIRGTGDIYHCAIVRLQIYYGITSKNAEVHAYNFTRRGSNVPVREALFVYNPHYSLFLSARNLYYAYQNDLDTHRFDFNDAGADSLDCVAFYVR